MKTTRAAAAVFSLTAGILVAIGSAMPVAGAEDDMRICHGFNTLTLPEGATIKDRTAEVEFYRFRVENRPMGEVEDVLRMQPKVGRVLFETQVGAWHYLSAVKDQPGNEPPLFLILLAGQRVGDDVVIAESDASVSVVGDGDGPELRSMFAAMTVVPEDQRRPGSGFCMQGYHFTYGAPELMSRFTLAATDTRRDGCYNLTFVNTPEQAGDDRPPFPNPGMDALGLDSETQPIEVKGFEGEVTTIYEPASEGDRVAHNALVAGNVAHGPMPLVFAEYLTRPRDEAGESLARLLSLLQSIEGN